MASRRVLGHKIPTVPPHERYRTAAYREMVGCVTFARVFPKMNSCVHSAGDICHAPSTALYSRSDFSAGPVRLFPRLVKRLRSRGDGVGICGMGRRVVAIKSEKALRAS